ncbi:hypothetical protein DY000_02021284 [Brassica cretica]|uniref:Uncharacterized protein n=1 Tax=Brassica cretica TaxID=69181 RepID=A0ABQ7E0S0_BRACR|nr:hypothetical protein DY000_02021284 [Brassica cretica]
MNQSAIPALVLHLSLAVNQSARIFVVVSVMTPPLFRLAASLSCDLVDDEALGVSLGGSS